MDNNIERKKTVSLVVKIIIAIAAVAGLISLFIITQSNNPETVDPQYSDLGEKVIDTVDDYLDFEITTNEAYSIIDDLYNRIDGLKKQDDMNLECQISSITIESCIIDIRHNLYCQDEDSYSKILSNRNRIADVISESKR
jgi:hypothetical protein